MEQTLTLTVNVPLTQNPAMHRWWSAMDRVRRALPVGSRLDTWQLDVYSDEPYCDNFRGEPPS